MFPYEKTCRTGRTSLARHRTFQGGIRMFQSHSRSTPGLPSMGIERPRLLDCEIQPLHSSSLPTRCCFVPWVSSRDSYAAFLNARGTNLGTEDRAIEFPVHFKLRMRCATIDECSRSAISAAASSASSIASSVKRPPLALQLVNAYFLQIS